MASDRLSFNPHAAFVKSLTDEDRAGYRSVMQLPHVRSAFTDVLAQMARNGSTREQLDGAVAFIDLFQNFAEPAPVQSQLPQRTLKSLA